MRVVIDGGSGLHGLVEREHERTRELFGGDAAKGCAKRHGSLIEVFVEVSLVDGGKGGGSFERSLVPGEGTRRGRVGEGVASGIVVGHEAKVQKVFKGYLHLLSVIAQRQFAPLCLHDG